MPYTALVLGCGYLGKRVAARWHDAGWHVQVVTRSQAHAEQFAAAGWHPVIADVTRPETLEHLPLADVVLYAVGFDRTSEPTIHEVYTGGVRHLLSVLSERTKRLIYISTTGVYGDAGGDWIDESTTPEPSRAGGIASLAAEQLIAESSFADRAAMLRLAGIYGPDRLPYLKLLEAGEPIEAAEAGYLNLIHVDDAAMVVELLGDPTHTLAGPQVYCVSDGHPVVRGDYYREAAQLLGAPEPRFATPAEGSPRAARAGANRRVSNRKLTDALGLRLKFPSYREGLRDIIGAGRSV